MVVRRLPLMLGVLLATASLAASGTSAADRTDARPAESKLRPAVLVVPTWDAPRRGGPDGRVKVVDPPGRPQDEDDGVGMGLLGATVADEPAPSLPLGYQLLGALPPDPLLPGVRYRVYIDLRHPGVAQHWRQWQRARYAEERRERWRRDSDRDIQQRRRRLLNTHEAAVRAGVQQMQAGEYREAVLSFTLAAELNHGDPACRIYLALARVALGHDGEAGQSLRRALELQPKLVPIQLGLEQYFPTVDDYDAQVEALAERLAKNRKATADEYYLLGFLEFQRSRFDEAHAAFARARAGLPEDERLQQYVALTKPPAR